MTNPSKKPKGSSYERAIKILARRPHSTAEVKQKLLDKGYDWQDVRTTIERLVRLRFLDDRSFASQWVRYRAESSKWGRQRIEGDLKSKKVHSQFIEEAFDDYYEEADSDWQEKANALLLQKYGPWDFMLDDAVEESETWPERQDAMKALQKATAKRINFLLRRGFSSEQAQKALAYTKGAP